MSKHLITVVVAASLAAGLLALNARGTSAQAQIETVVLSGDDAPGTVGAKFQSLNYPIINDAGDVASYAVLTGGDVTSDNNIGLYKESNGTLELVVRKGDQALPSGERFLDFPDVNIADNGDLVFSTRFSTATDRAALFRESGGVVTLLAKLGDPAPGTGEDFSAFSIAAPAINAFGEVAFFGTLAPSGDDVIYRTNGSGLELVARENSSVDPGGVLLPVGAEFAILTPPLITDAGDVAFFAFLKGTIPSGQSRGVFVHNGGTLSLPVQSGVTEFDDGGVTKTIADLTDRSQDINNNGDLSFADQTSWGGPTRAFKLAGGLVSLIAQEGVTTLPDGSLISTIIGPIIDGNGDVVLGAITDSGGRVIVKENGGVLDFVAKSGEPAPGGAFIMSAVTLRGANSAGEVTYFALGEGQRGLFLEDIPLVVTGDMVDDGTLTSFTLAPVGFTNLQNGEPDVIGDAGVVGFFGTVLPSGATTPLSGIFKTSPSLDPVDRISRLIQRVTDLNLQMGIGNSLDVKLENATKALDDLNNNNDRAAINALNAFINEVEAQRGDKISAEDADALIAEAQAIIDQLTQA